MRLLRAEVVGVGPFDSLAFPFVDEEDKPRLMTVVPGPMDVLKARIEKELGWNVKTPAYQEKMEI